MNYALKQVVYGRNRPKLTFEERLARAFPGSEWVPNLEPDPSETEASSLGVGLEPAASSAVAVVGGAKFDRKSLRAWMDSLPRDTLIVTGVGRSRKDGTPMDAEAAVRQLGAELGIRVDVVEPREDLYGNRAPAAAIERILTITTGDIVVVGTGGRVNTATDWWHRMNLHERDERGALVKKQGEFVSHRSPENRRGLTQIAKESKS